MCLAACQEGKLQFNMNSLQTEAHRCLGKREVVPSVFLFEERNDGACWGTVSDKKFEHFFPPESACPWEQTPSQSTSWTVK